MKKIRTVKAIQAEAQKKKQHIIEDDWIRFVLPGLKGSRDTRYGKKKDRCETAQKSQVLVKAGFERHMSHDHQKTTKAFKKIEE
jgi:hypothetical protein